MVPSGPIQTANACAGQRPETQVCQQLASIDPIGEHPARDRSERLGRQVRGQGERPEGLGASGFRDDDRLHREEDPLYEGHHRADTEEQTEGAGQVSEHLGRRCWWRPFGVAPFGALTRQAHEDQRSHEQGRDRGEPQAFHTARLSEPDGEDRSDREAHGPLRTRRRSSARHPPSPPTRVPRTTHRVDERPPTRFRRSRAASAVTRIPSPMQSPRRRRRRRWVPGPRARGDRIDPRGSRRAVAGAQQPRKTRRRGLPPS